MGYGDDATRLCDLVRGSIVYQSLAGIRLGLEKIAERVDIVRLKNRFDPSYDADQTAGYRDVSLLFQVIVGSSERRHICECQLQHQEIYRRKTRGGHARYKSFRNKIGH